MSPTSRGILAMSASVVVFIFNDALIKLAAETVPSVVEVKRTPTSIGLVTLAEPTAGWSLFAKIE